MYTVEFNDGEVFADNIATLEEARDIRDKHNFDFFSRNLIVYNDKGERVIG